MNLPWLLLLVSAHAALSQEPNNRHGVGSGEGYEKPSAIYVARTPYKLQWSAEATYKIAPGSTWRGKDDSLAIHVVDSDSGRIVANTGWTGLRGEVLVPQGGRHFLRVFALGKWSANIIEDLAQLKQAQREGYLTKDSIIDEKARAASPVGKREAVATAAKEAIAKLQGERDTVSSGDPERISKLNRIDHEIYLVNLAASRSSDVQDFHVRLSALLAAAGK